MDPSFEFKRESNLFSSGRAAAFLDFFLGFCSDAAVPFFVLFVRSDESDRLRFCVFIYFENDSVPARFLYEIGLAVFEMAVLARRFELLDFVHDLELDGRIKIFEMDVPLFIVVQRVFVHLGVTSGFLRVGGIF